VSVVTAAGTVRDALAAATDALAAAGVEGPRFDAELLLAEAMGVDRARIHADPAAPVEPDAGRRFGTMIRRRVAREPVAYILGRRWFAGIELAVDPRVLIPRPETELLVDLALELRPGALCDVGTGSGAIALAIADRLASVRIFATDTSGGALEVARANARRLGLSDRVVIERGTLPGGEPADLVVANLPYVSEGEWASLAPEITRYEPREAVVAGPTGLEAIAALIESLGDPAHRPGALALEVGAGQATDVGELLRARGWTSIESRRDLSGIDRVVVARRHRNAR
jgi:release factor glutamine methyltransferase